MMVLLLAGAGTGSRQGHADPSVAATTPPEPILVDDFEAGTTQGLFAQRKNYLDAFQGTWARRPSFAVITKVPDTRPGHTGNSLRVEYNKIGGWCGWYTLLNGIDVSRHNALTFWIKGEQGGERFDIGLADNQMQDLEIDAVYAGPIMAFLLQGVTTEWQQAKIPLAGLRSDLKLNRMGSLVLWFRYEGKGAIEIDDVSFVYDPEVERTLEENVPRAALDPRAPRAAWVWKYDPLIHPQVSRELLEFCRRTALSTLYVYLGEDPISRMPQERQERLAEFLTQAHSLGMQILALQGNPLWALKANHPIVLSWVKGYLDFNKGRPADQQINGVSLDIEPYLTAEWEGENRERLKKEFLELLAALRQMIDAEAVRPKRAVDPSTKAQDERRVEGAFRLGVAIPTFYEREPQFEEELLRQVDVAALMDYYDTGREIIEHGRFHMDLARRLGKKIIIGVETQDIVQMGQGKRRNTFHEEGWQEMEQQLAQVVNAFASNPAFGGLAIHAYDSYRLLQKGRNVPTRERTGKIPSLTATRANPAHPVTIDGNLEQDWASISWTQIDQRSQVAYGPGAWAGPHDTSFKAAFQWEPEALLIAIDVTDNRLVQESKGANMWEGDHAEVWIDSDLYGDYNEAVNSSDDFQVGLSPGNFKNLKPEVHVWVPSVDPRSLGGIQIAAQKKEFGYTLEARLPTKALFQTILKRVGVEPIAGPGGIARKILPERAAFQEGILNSGILKAGFKLGVMVDLSDTDEARQPQKCLLSTSLERQWGDPTTFNILELK